MSALMSYLKSSIVSGFVIFLMGCTNVQIVRLPFISPVVVPAPEVFRMNVAVKNYSEIQTSRHLFLDVYSEYFPAPGQPHCSQHDSLEVGVLAPGKSWGHADYQIDRGSSFCRCIKGFCTGHVWLTLTTDRSGPHRRITGPNTALHVNWSASGNLGEMTIREE